MSTAGTYTILDTDDLIIDPRKANLYTCKDDKIGDQKNMKNDMLNKIGDNYDNYNNNNDNNNRNNNDNNSNNNKKNHNSLLWLNSIGDFILGQPSAGFEICLKLLQKMWENLNDKKRNELSLLIANNIMHGKHSLPVNTTTENIPNRNNKSKTRSWYQFREHLY